MLHAIEINERLNALVFSEDGNYLITGGTGRLVVVRDIRQSLAVVSRINGSMKTYGLVDREVLAPPCSHLLNLFCFCFCFFLLSCFVFFFCSVFFFFFVSQVVAIVATGVVAL